ncbi:MAG: caiD 6 [Acidimicrobiales bacterium]|nr:caiD 6 [Acidimicrobiales bacterium]
MTEPELVEDRQGAVQILRLNRPAARNALTPGLISALGFAFERAEHDPEIRCAVLTGTGDRAFCAGMDLRAFADGVRPSEEDQAGMKAFARFARGQLTIPVVGAANATAVAGGFELLLGCDVVVASEAANFGLPEVKRGLFAAGGGVFLSTRIPRAIAMELTLTGDSIGAARALALGLVNEVVAPEQVLDAAVRLAERIARNGPLGLSATKALAQAARGNDDEAWNLLGEWQARVFASDDAKEGASAFVEKRDPVWRGR